MIALDAEHVGSGGAGSRQLPAAAVGELEAGAGVGTGTGTHIPLIGYRHLLREIHRHRPVAQCRGAAVGDTHVHLEESASCIGGHRGAGVSGECFAAQQQTGQQHSILNKYLHFKFPS